jgi:CDP-4-dehydro-6-deoxyglucose reductase/ferredoxin-NAD(P)+ reductase (naphthalene dioxygenase ferredoxin-specific)
VQRVSIRNQPTVVLTGRDTILAAALDAGVPYPHDCRTGTCGTCKSRLLDGRVDMLPYAPEALNPAEAASGLILACRARARTDIVVEWLGETDHERPPVRTLKAEVTEIRLVAPEVIRLRLHVLGQPLFFAAGQYADLSFARRPPRSFSMANPPSETTLEFHIRRLDGVASGYVADRLKVGDRVRVKGPYGNAYLRPHGRPLLAIAGGTGLAPLRSIVLTALDQDADASVHLYLGVRDEADLYGDDELSALTARHTGFHFVPVLSAPSGPTARRTGMVHEAVAADFGRLDGHVVHIAGPPVMVEVTKALALQRGAAPSAILSDPFQPHGKDTGTGLMRVIFALRSSFRRKTAEAAD